VESNNMPLYDVKCPNCGEIKDIWAGIDENQVICPQCGAKTERLMSPTRIICDLTPYFDENLADAHDVHGKWVESRQHKREIMKAQDLVEIG
jgi:putative FmdB family regulatory protein